jgi:hypothetical protein
MCDDPWISDIDTLSRHLYFLTAKNHCFAPNTMFGDFYC